MQPQSSVWTRTSEAAFLSPARRKSAPASKLPRSIALHRCNGTTHGPARCDLPKKWMHLKDHARSSQALELKDSEGSAELGTTRVSLIWTEFHFLDRRFTDLGQISLT